MSNAAARPHAPVFTQGNLMRHVAVMTATGSIGLIAIFSVDVLSLFWVSRLGVDSYKAAIGYASQLSFVLMSVNIGLTIAISAMRLARARRRRPAARATLGRLGTAADDARDARARRRCSGGYRDSALDRFMHARGEAAEVASGLLAIIIPANIADGARHGAVPACCAPAATRAAPCM